MSEEELERRLGTDIVRIEDGRFVYWPTTNGGYYPAYLLRQIADLLDKKNEEVCKP